MGGGGAGHYWPWHSHLLPLRKIENVGSPAPPPMLCMSFAWTIVGFLYSSLLCSFHFLMSYAVVLSKESMLIHLGEVQMLLYVNGAMSSRHVVGLPHMSFKHVQTL